MPANQHNTTSQRIKWTDEMIADLLQSQFRLGDLSGKVFIQHNKYGI